METLLNSDILKLFVILLAIVAIVFMFLKYRKDDGQRKIHIYYISGLCVFIILELVTYVCVNNDNATDIVSYISFASLYLIIRVMHNIRRLTVPPIESQCP